MVPRFPVSCCSDACSLQDGCSYCYRNGRCCFYTGGCSYRSDRCCAMSCPSSCSWWHAGCTNWRLCSFLPWKWNKWQDAGSRTDCDWYSGRRCADRCCARPKQSDDRSRAHCSSDDTDWWWARSAGRRYDGPNRCCNSRSCRWWSADSRDWFHRPFPAVWCSVPARKPSCRSGRVLPSVLAYNSVRSQIPWR